MFLLLLLGLLLFNASLARGAFVEPPESRSSQRSFTDSQTRLPCRYQPTPGEKVVQATWYKELKDGTKDQMITAHFTDGHTEFGRYAGRVSFASSSPTEDSALVLKTTELSDQGLYTCHISTFPNGNFDRSISLTVWSLPISSLEPVVMKEGGSFGLAASCRSMGLPAPSLSWDTPLVGQVQNRSSESGAVTSLFSLHPLRAMNGKKLDCLVSYPGFDSPRRISNTLEVQYPPEVKISPGSGHWFVGMEKAELHCEAKGQPPVSNITWTWRGGALPEGSQVSGSQVSGSQVSGSQVSGSQVSGSQVSGSQVSGSQVSGSQVSGSRLVLGRALRLNDSGVFQCVAQNHLGPGRAEYDFTVTERSFLLADISDNLLMVLIGAGAGLLLLMLLLMVLVNRHHKNKHKRLQQELSQKTEEINSLSRQNSMRRLNSVNSDPRSQPEDFALLRVDSRMKHSQMSLERPLYRGSQATLSGRWAPPGGGEVDELGRPALWSEGDEPEREERRTRVESYLKTSNMSLDSGLPLSLKPHPEEVLVPCRELPHLRQAPPSPNMPPWTPPSPLRWTPPGPPDEDTDSSSFQIAEALHNHFYYSNGQLRPRPHSNAILLQPSRQGSVVRTSS